jgi:hypothetical protein
VLADQRPVLRRPVVERRADDEHDIRLREQLGCDRRCESTGDPERVGEVCEQTVGRSRSCQQSARDLSERIELGAGVGEHRATARDDRRPLGRGEQIRHAVDRVGCGLGWREIGARWPCWLRTQYLLGLDVDREHQHDRPLLDQGTLVGALCVVGGRLWTVDAVGNRADRLDEVVLVDPEV